MVPLLLSHIVLIIISAGMLFPFFWMLGTSLKTLPEASQMPPIWWPSNPQWGNYKEMFSLAPLARFYWNSVVVAVGVTVGSVFTSSLAAFAFARLQFRGRDSLFLLYLATLMVPGQVTMIPAFIVVRYLGWIDTYRGLILPGCFSAFGTFLLRQFFLTIPRDLEDAATVDGCSPFRVYWQVIMPLVRPALAALAIFSFLGSWNNLLWPLVVTTKMEMRTIPVGLTFFQGQYVTMWHLLMAAAVVALVPLIVVYIIAQKYFVEGITLGAIKG
ncbi:MAG: sugar ABC transporter permease [Armatimonadetes bacterium RBG_16_58_9]|nr:MAG: sugar ABC transporter permease [Armatimonadetes bacterium RBG_16_58_9]